MTEPLDITLTLNSRQNAWTVAELAKLLNFSPTGIYSAVARGTIPAVKIGTATRFNPKAIADWWANQCATA